MSYKYIPDRLFKNERYLIGDKAYLVVDVSRDWRLVHLQEIVNGSINPSHVGLWIMRYGRGWYPCVPQLDVRNECIRPKRIPGRMLVLDQIVAR